MNLDVRRIRATLCVADQLSFSQAAREIGISQPALSTLVQNLERELGFLLFDRTTRRVELTRRGRLLVNTMRPLVQASDQLERQVRTLQREDKAKLVIGTAIYTIDFPNRIAFLESLIRNFPKTTIEIQTGLAQTEIVESLSTGTLDLAILMGIVVSADEYQAALTQNQGTESLINSDLDMITLGRNKVGLLIPNEIAEQRRFNVNDLHGQKVAIFHPGHGAALYSPIAEYLEGAGAELVIPPESNAIGVERYGQQFGIPAVTLNWFPRAANNQMTYHELPALKLKTSLVLARHTELETQAIDAVFKFAEAHTRQG